MSQAEDKRRLLKMKQGIIEEEAEIVHEERYEKPKTFSGKLKNFIFYYKWQLLIGILLIGFLIYFLCTWVFVTPADIKVYCVGGNYTTSAREVIALALEDYCPDFNGDGVVHVEIVQSAYDYTMNTPGDSGDENKQTIGSIEQHREIENKRCGIFIGQEVDLIFLFDDYKAAKNIDIFGDLSYMANGTPLRTDYMIDLKSVKPADKWNSVFQRGAFICYLETDDAQEENAKTLIRNIYTNTRLNINK